MRGSLLFVHGTGVRDIERSIRHIRDGIGARGLPANRVSGAEWGRAVGPPDLDIGPVLPPEARARDVEGGPTEAAVAVALWDLLVTDPLLELRILGEMAPTDDDRVVVGEAPADEQIKERLRAADVGEAALVEAGVPAEALRVALDAVADSDEVGLAASARGSAVDPNLIEAAARSVVACLIAQDNSTKDRPRVESEEARDALVLAIEKELAPEGEGRGLGAALAGKVLAPLATRFAMRRRAALMDPTTDFIRDVAFYVQHGERVRAFMLEELSKLPQDQPVVLLGHSLGGIAAVDLLAGRSGGPRVDLLVTVGSQAPLLFLMDALDALSYRRNGPGNRPFTPWLNIYDSADLLSFLAAGAWPNETGITDEAVSSGVPFPASHGAYWGNSRVYDLLASHWPR